ncbi:MAG: peptidoglycan DD-metalloendopeptidase family protein [Thermomicrobiales bacterium]|nr:peptidoglycan DD-metalloendopeptidase family protein [Thermomicrobiales bacterium]
MAASVAGVGWAAPPAGSPRADAEQTPTPDGSVRVQGQQAPVALRPTPSLAQGPKPEPRAGVAKRPNADPNPSRTAAQRGEPAGKEAKAAANVRIWPLRKNAFTFTQAFGCVTQIGGFYHINTGCPADRPVVHGGVDLAAPAGTRIYAAASGWITEAGLDRPEGLANTRIVVQHDGRNDGYATEYLHWSVSYVAPGDYVRAGDPIAEVGSVGYSTGPHLHFAVIDFATGDYVDPLRWLPRDASTNAYRGLAPDARPIRFGSRSAALPDYADPEPPPVPTKTRTPERNRTQAKHGGKTNKRGQTDAGASGKRDRTQTKSDDRGVVRRSGKNRTTSKIRTVSRDGVATTETDAGADTDSAREERRQRRADRIATREAPIRDGSSDVELVEDASSRESRRDGNKHGKNGKRADGKQTSGANEKNARNNQKGNGAGSGKKGDKGGKNAKTGDGSDASAGGKTEHPKHASGGDQPDQPSQPADDGGAITEGVDNANGASDTDAASRSGKRDRQPATSETSVPDEESTSGGEVDNHSAVASETAPGADPPAERTPKRDRPEP